MPQLPEILPNVWNLLVARKNSGQPFGLPTGITELDDMLGQGWPRQKLTYLVGDSAVGKSWLATWFILKGAQWLAENPDLRPLSGYTPGQAKGAVPRQVMDKEGKPPLIVFWSLEMAEYDVVIRMMTQAAAILSGEHPDSALIRLGEFGPVDSREYQHTKDMLSAAFNVLIGDWGKHIYLNFDSTDVPSLEYQVKDLTRTNDILLVVVDYFRLIQDMYNEGNVAASQAAKSAQLKDIAHQYDCHVLVIFDITRIGQHAKQIELSHMKDGTAAQYDADVVLILDEHGRGKEGYGRYAPLNLYVKKNRFGLSGETTFHMDRANGLLTFGEEER